MLASQYRQPFWFDDALKQEDPAEPQGLRGAVNCDICIVGGGFTGLWTAIKIKQKAPQTEVVIIEAGLCGQGASGRNGGAMLTWSTKFPTLAKLYGTEQAIELVKASEQAVGGIFDFCQKHGIDAEVRVDGAYYTATNPAQQGILLPVLNQLDEHRINQWHKVDNSALHRATGSGIHLEGVYTAKAGSLHPGKLVRGLRRVAQQMGVRIFENTPMKELFRQSGYRVVCEHGQVNARKVVMATNSWMARQFAELQRRVVLVSSDMVITKPIPDLLAKLGLEHGASVIDLRTFVHYYRTTEDGRLMLGKGGNTFSFANKMRPLFNKPSEYEGQLQATLKQFFGTDLPLERSWNGASDRSATGFPFFGQLSGKPGVYYGLGYSGNGVVQTFLGGDILSSLALGKDDSWSTSALVDAPAKPFPPEPFRFVGSLMVRNAIRRKERREDAGHNGNWLDCQLAKLANFAGKAD